MTEVQTFVTFEAAHRLYDVNTYSEGGIYIGKPN